MIEYGRHRVVISDDEEYIWEPDEVTLGEQRSIIDEFASSGGTRSYRAWIRAIGVDEDPDAVQVLVWFLHRKAGRQEVRFEVDVPSPRHIRIENISSPADVKARIVVLEKQLREAHMQLDELEAAGEDGDDDPEASAGSEPAT